MYTIQTISHIINGTFLHQYKNDEVRYLVYDSRKIQFAESSLFFALSTAHNNGHYYITDAYNKGIRNFVISRPVALENFPDCNIITVADVLLALQALTQYHRSQFTLPVIGITGSNGKTIVKEWLYQLLEPDFHIVRSPKSYNSQIGVPLSVWEINGQHTLAIFEAGVSQRGEMKALASIIQPAIGVLTNIGEAHNEGFDSMEQKLAEKLQLFQTAAVIIAEYGTIKNHLQSQNIFTWGYSKEAIVYIQSATRRKNETTVQLVYKAETIEFKIPFTDDAAIHNAVTCCCILLYLNYTAALIRERFVKLHPVDMRLQLKSGINGCIVINDSYSADITSLQAALNFLHHQHTRQARTVILSDFFESGKKEQELYSTIAAVLGQYKIQKAILIGEAISTVLPLHLNESVACTTYSTTESFIDAFRTSLFKDETVLIKGARRFEFERIAHLFEAKVHQTRLEIDLNAIAHNFKEYKKALKSGTKVMAMVKAFAYGSGGAEIASVLQYHNCDYLGVAYTDEGVELRKAGLTLPVMVMNADETSFDALVDYNLQPVIYSFSLLHAFSQYVHTQGLPLHPVHIEIETGMNRLGFAASQIDELCVTLHQLPYLKIETVFSHLAASDDMAQKKFTEQQASVFFEAVDKLQASISYPFLRHLANSAAIVLHPHLQLDMVRLGIGLYGIETDSLHKLQLQPVATLRSTIAQLKFIKKGESVSYNRTGIMQQDSIIATVRIGYADGYSRRLSNGTGKMWIAGLLAPVVGVVCMDMTMIDVTDIPDVKEGDEVVVFGAMLSVQQVAQWMNTIPYEVMTGISQRVKRIYFQE